MPRDSNTVLMDDQVFGNLTVLGRAGSRVRAGKKAYATWRCKCTCGQEVEVVGQHLRRGLRTSCGIDGHFSKRAPGPTTIHPSEYSSWESMHERCENPKHKNWRSYGGRGIVVCERWSKFTNFLHDMGVKPYPEFTIERRNNDLGYTLENCRWASRSEQYRNMRRNVYVTYQGKRMLLFELVKTLGLSRSVVDGRLKMGWSLEDTLSIEVRRHPAQRKKKKAIPLTPVVT